MRIIHFLGYQGGGKTRAISYVARELAGRHLRVGTLKHVHEPGFTLDARGKDSWVHAISGARFVVVLSPGEIATIEKRDTGRIEMGGVLELFREKGIEYLLVEGFSGEFHWRKDTRRILCVRTMKDALGLMATHKSLLCVLGGLSDAPDQKSIGGVPVIRLPKDGPRLLRLIGQPRGEGRGRRIRTPPGRSASSG